jgi:hypothetical protein
MTLHKVTEVQLLTIKKSPPASVFNTSCQSQSPIKRRSLSNAASLKTCPSDAMFDEHDVLSDDPSLEDGDTLLDKRRVPSQLCDRLEKKMKNFMTGFHNKAL